MAAGSGPFIEVRNLVAAYDGKVAVDSISFAIDEGEHVSLLGPSGCGKSTTLRCIAGLETPVSGEIVIGSQTVFSAERRINVPPEKRNLSMVFQSYAIWPHMTVFENAAYGLRARGVKGAAVRERTERALTMVGMLDYIDRPATDLSGGQQQRVALARSYASAPSAILLDEPLSNLDARLRVRMREELKELQRGSNLSTIYVTHDQEEAMAISDRIIVMSDARIVQIGQPLDIYNTPRTRFVADFIGAANIIAGRMVGDAAMGDVRLVVGEAEILCAARKDVPVAGADGSHMAAVRTVYPELQRSANAALANQWPAVIRRRILLGDIVSYVVGWPGGELRVHGFPGNLFEEGEKLFLYIPRERVVLVEADAA